MVVGARVVGEGRDAYTVSCVRDTPRPTSFSFDEQPRGRAAALLQTRVARGSASPSLCWYRSAGLKTTGRLLRTNKYATLVNEYIPREETVPKINSHGTNHRTSRVFSSVSHNGALATNLGYPFFFLVLPTLQGRPSSS